MILVRVSPLWKVGFYSPSRIQNGCWNSCRASGPSGRLDFTESLQDRTSFDRRLPESAERSNGYAWAQSRYWNGVNTCCLALSFFPQGLIRVKRTGPAG
jgi:hypothetical protein